MWSLNLNGESNGIAGDDTLLIDINGVDRRE